MRGLKRLWNALPSGARRRLRPAVGAPRATPAPPLAQPRSVPGALRPVPGCSAASELAEGQPWFRGPEQHRLRRHPDQPGRAGAARRRRARSGFRASVCDELATDLLDIVKVESGEPLVLDVSRASDHYERLEPGRVPRPARRMGSPLARRTPSTHPRSASCTSRTSTGARATTSPAGSCWRRARGSRPAPPPRRFR